MFLLVRVVSYLFLLALSASALFSSQEGAKSDTASLYPSCDPEWQAVSTSYGYLYDVDGVSGSDMWLLGYTFGSGGSSQPVMIHWDGSQFTTFPPGIANWNNSLYGVSATSSNDVWAVGGHNCEEGCQEQLLIEHWNGSQWGVVGGPNTPIVNSYLSAVDGIATNDVWAVGHYYPLGGPTGTLILHWNGNQWIVVPSTNLNLTNAANLSAVDALSATDVWAAGGDQYGNPHSLIGHWDGNTWNLSSTPNIGRIADIKAISANDVWAVGVTNFLHWDGTTWTEVPNPVNGTMEAIDGTATDDVWAVGNGVIVHWDGTLWSEVPGPGGNHSILRGVYAASADDVWAIGTGTTGRDWDVEHFYPVPCPPPCPSERFTDVCSSDYFYQSVLDLNDLNVISGYNTAPPCDGAAHIPCFKPYNQTTRGQVSKVISLAADFTEPVSGQSFEDVPPNHTFYEYVGRMASRNIIVGYPCGGPGEPCGIDNLPYFRVGAAVNRAQLAKMTALSFGFDDEASGQTFEDVVPENHFYPFIENLASRQIINGYACGGDGEPCVPPLNRPYFKYANLITRGQIAKIVNLARLEVLPTPTVTSTPLPTDTPTVEPTSTGTAVPTSTP